MKPSLRLLIVGGTAFFAVADLAFAQPVPPQPPAGPAAAPLPPRGPAAGAAPIYDPQQLPAIKGTVSRYTLTPRGDVDGLILSDGTEVHFPPHLSTQLVYAVKPGDAATVRGLKALSLPKLRQCPSPTTHRARLSSTTVPDPVPVARVLAKRVTR